MNNNGSEAIEIQDDRSKDVHTIRVKQRDWTPFKDGLETINMRPNRAINLFIQWFNEGRLTITEATLEIEQSKIE